MAEVTDRRQIEDERTTKILDAVGEVVMERGTSGLTTALVARRARVAPGKFYELFSDKYAVLEAATERNLGRYLDRVSQALVDEPAADFVQVGLVGLDVFVEMCREDPGFRALRFWRAPQGTAEDGLDADSRMVAVWARMLSVRFGIEDTPELRHKMAVGSKLVTDPVEYAFAIDPTGDPQVLEDARRVLAFYLSA